jgi:outer membrane protein insertion porin family
MQPRFLVAHGALAFVLFAGGAAAQVNRFEGKPIAEIQYSSPDSLDPADLAKVQPLQKGEPLRRDDVAHAIDGLFATGRFKDIRVEAEPVGDGVRIRFVTEPQWFVGAIALDGKITAPPNRAELISNAQTGSGGQGRGGSGAQSLTGQLTLGSPFRDEDVEHASDSMKALLKANGYYEAQVQPQIERDEHGQLVFITFLLREQNRAKYAAPVIQGEPKIPDSTVLRVTGWRIPIIHWWRKVSDSRTRKGVQNLLGRYHKQDRLLARVDVQQLEYDAQKNRVHPHLDIEPGPKVKVEAVEAKVSKRVIKRYVPIYQENAVDTDLLVQGKRNLQDYFENQGYYDAGVDFRVLPPEKDQQVIQYVISRGQRFKLVRVNVVGNHYFDTDSIRERMFMRPAALTLRRGRYNEAFRHRDETTVSDLYKSNGFRDVDVTTSIDRNYRGKPGDIAVTLTITEGSQWLVDSLTVNGVGQVSRDELMSRVSLTAGQPFSETGMAVDRNSILTFYYERGFAAANMNSSWEMSGTPNHVNVVYSITEGERQYVRGVLTSGLQTTRPKIVNKIILLNPGAPLSPVEQTDIQKRLYDLGIFARVDTAVENPDGSASHKFVLYNFEEANRYAVNVGVGAQVARFGQPSSQSLGSPGGSTGFSPQISVDVSRLNFMGIGHTVTVRGAYSSISKLGSITYLQPHPWSSTERTLTYTLLYNKELDVRTFASTREEGSVQLSQRFSKSVTGLMRFSYRRVSVGNVIIPVLLIPQLVQPVRIGMLSGNFVQDRRDNSANPHKGIYNTADIGIAGRFFGSQRSFGRILVRNATYHRIGANMVLARQTQFGVILPFSAPTGLTNSESVPLPERFFGGGADSLRAFPYNQAGPRDIGAALVPGGPASAPTGFPLGGNALLFNNVELRFPLIGENIQGVFFHDMGNVYRTFSSISFRYSQKDLHDFNYMAQAAGFGVRYRTPVGPIRVDLAYSLNPPSFLGFGGTPQQILRCDPNLPQSELPGFCQPTKQNVSHFQFFFSIGQTF